MPLVAISSIEGTPDTLYERAMEFFQTFGLFNAHIVLYKFRMLVPPDVETVLFHGSFLRINLLTLEVLAASILIMYSII